MPAPRSGHRLSERLRSFAVLAALVFHPALNAQLSERSPFLPPDFDQPQSTESSEINAVNPSSIQFKGFFELNGIPRFNLYDPQSDRGHWLHLNESVNGMRVLRFNAENRNIDVEINGHSTRLSLASPSDSPLDGAGGRRITRPADGNITPAVRRQPTVRPRVIAPPRPGGASPRQRAVPRTIVRPQPNDDRQND